MEKAKPGEISWDSPFGKGRPGWHIECSVMAYHELERQSIFMQEGQIYNSLTMKMKLPSQKHTIMHHLRITGCTMDS